MAIKITKKIKGYSVQKPEDKAKETQAAPATDMPLSDEMVERESASNIIQMHEKVERPEALVGATYKIKSPLVEHAMYVTINDIVLNQGTPHELRRPFEVFINSKNMEHYAWTVGLTRMISAVFRRGGNVSFVVEELKAVFDPRGGSWLNGRYVPSLLAAIGDVIQRHLDSDTISASMPTGTVPSTQKTRPRFCPKCSAGALIRSEGCDKCLECGYSKCS